MKTVEESFGIIPLKHELGKWKVLLILHQGGHHWAFPKGHGNPGESPIQSAQRELKEETGLEVYKLLQDEPLIERYRFQRQRQTIFKTVLYYPALVQGNLKLQVEEIQDAKWVLLEAAVLHLTFKEAKRMCQKLLIFLKSYPKIL